MGRGHDRAPPRPVSNARWRHLQRRDRPSRSPRRREGHRSSRVDREETVLTSAAACSNPLAHRTSKNAAISGLIKVPAQRYDQADVCQRNHFVMPEQETIERAREDEREGKAPSTQAGEFVREEMEHIREGKHGARSTKQAIAIGLSKARRAGVKLPPPKRGSARTKKQAARDSRKGKTARRRKPSRTRSRAVRKALKRESSRAASHRALSRQARSAARMRTKASRSRAAKKAARTRKRNR